MGAGNDTILNSGISVAIIGGDGDDDIWSRVNSVSIDGGAGNDTLENEDKGINVTITGGAGDDSIFNKCSDVSIIGGSGDDVISLSGNSKNNFIQYTAGDGNDTIWGMSEGNAKLQIGDGTGTYSTQPGGDDVIIKVGTGSITLKDYRGEPKHDIIGSSGTSGGGSGNGGGGNSGSGGSGGGGSTSGTSNSGSNSAASGGNNSASGTGGGTSGGSSGTNSGRGNDNANTTANQLWGNVNYDDAVFGGGDADTFTGTEDADTFVSGKNQGSDTFRNISTKDTIYLNDVTLSDLVSVKDVNGFIYLGFNTGSTLTIQSAELLSGAIQLADGTAHRFNHMTRTWQKA